MIRSMKRKIGPLTLPNISTMTIDILNRRSTAYRDTVWTIADDFA